MPSIFGQFRKVLGGNQFATNLRNPLPHSRLKVSRELELAEIVKELNDGSRPLRDGFMVDDVTLHDPKWKSGDDGHGCA
jgi:hypothetical protein